MRWAGDPAALNGMTTGVNPDVVQTEVGKQWIENQGISCDYRYYSSGNALFDALSSGEVDAIIMNDTISSADAMPVFSVGESNYFFAVPKSRQDLMDDINAAMAMLRSTNPRYNDEVKTRYSARNSGSSALTGPESAWLADHGNAITIGYLDNLLPFSNTGQDGQIEGSLSALVNTLEKQYGITVNAVPFDSNKELTDALRDSSIDVAMPINKDFWLAEQAGFIQSSVMATTSLVAIYTGGNLDDALKNIAFHDRSLLDSCDLQVRYPEATITQYPTAHACVDAIKAGKATCMIMTVTGLDTLRDEVDLGSLVTAEMPKSIELACWMRQGDAQLLSIVNKGIVSAADDIAASAYSHYSYSDGQSEFAQFVEHNRVAILTGIGALLVGAIAILAWSLHSAREAQRRAQEASAAKTAFLSRMSHDIRTPLNGILGLLELNGQHPDDAEANSQNREKAKVAANHLLTLINDILEMSKIEDHAVELENLPFNLTDLCRDIFVLGQIRANSRDVTLTTSGPDTFAYPDVYGSPLHVRRVFLNLVENCIKYNKPGGTVHCSGKMMDLVGDKTRLPLHHQRHGHRHVAGVPQAPVRAVRAGKRRRAQQLPGHGHGHAHREGAREEHGRRHLREKRARPRARRSPWSLPFVHQPHAGAGHGSEAGRARTADISRHAHPAGRGQRAEHRRSRRRCWSTTAPWSPPGAQRRGGASSCSQAGPAGAFDAILMDVHDARDGRLRGHARHPRLCDRPRRAPTCPSSP